MAALSLLAALLMTALVLGGCQSMAPPPLPVGLSSDDYRADLATIDRLLASGLYAPALAQIRGLLAEPVPSGSWEGLLRRAERCLRGLGRLEDAKVAARLAKSWNDTPERADELRDNLDDLLRRLSSTSPAGVRATAASPPSVAAPDSTSTVPDPLITNSFFETDIRQALQDLGIASGVPIIWDNSVEGIVTYEAKDVPLSAVIRDILYPAGYVYECRDGKYYIGSAGIDKPFFMSMSHAIRILLTNLKAEEAIMLLPETMRPYVSAASSANIVFVTAPRSLADQIASHLRAIDAPLPEVELEVIVVVFATKDIRALGIDITAKSADAGNASVGGLISSPAFGDAVLAVDYIRNALRIGGEKTDITASLKALEQAGIARIRATPRLRTLSGHTASLSTLKDQYFFITTEQPTQSFLYNRLETIRSGISLEMTPYVDTSGYVTVNVKPQVDDVVGRGANGLPEISRRTANTTVRVLDGETIAIGGLRVQETKETRTRVPILGRIPLLGLLFGSTSTEESESEIVIFITPRVR